MTLKIRVLFSAIAAALVLALVGCGGPQPEEAPNTAGGTAKGRLQTDGGAEATGGKAEGGEASADSPN
jgi:hypothetical protein